MLTMRFIERLQKNKLFKFSASLKLAIPLMLVLLIACAIGTVVESKYNAQVASIMVYRSPAFLVLLVLLWINIFNVIISRIPLKKHHTGFVTVHIGLLTLLAGAMLTATLGVDGELRIDQGAAENTVYQPAIVLNVRDLKTREVKSYALGRKLDRLGGSEFSKINSFLKNSGVEKTADEFYPFSTVVSDFVATNDENDPVALKFKLKSAFFTVEEWLNSKEQPVLTMGPATVKIVDAASKEKKTPVKAAPVKNILSAVAKKPIGVLTVKNADGSKVLAEVPVDTLKAKPLKLSENLSIGLKKYYAYAVVDGNKLVDKSLKDSGLGAKNPALELDILFKQTKHIRELAFANFPDFTVNPKGSLGLQFEYHVTEAEVTATLSGAAEPEPAQMPKTSNLIEFVTDKTSAVLKLTKNENKVLEQKIAKGELVKTPWMGMEVTLLDFLPHSKHLDRVVPLQLPERDQLPSSAIRIGGTWLSESESMVVGNKEIYYGQEPLRLPFHIHLKEFKKTDYPGTAMAMEFESVVHVEGQPDVRISMNEPMKHGGYTFYQASYSMKDGNNPMTILSVNFDPGRPMKYVGSLILCLGIIIFTLMRSNWYRTRSAAKFAAGLAVFLVSLSGFAATAEETMKPYTDFASTLNLNAAMKLPIMSNGRMKPLDTYARETMLYLHGKYHMKGLSAVQSYLGLMLYEHANEVQFIEIRETKLREALGFDKSKRYYSVQELEQTTLKMLAEPLRRRSAENNRALSPYERKIVEANSELEMAKAVVTGDHLLYGLQYGEKTKLVDNVSAYLHSVMMKNEPEVQKFSSEMLSIAYTVQVPELLDRYRSHINLELLYNDLQPFFWSAMLYILLALFIGIPQTGKFITKKLLLPLVLLPFSFHLFGFVSRIRITGFAPVTNMYGTMLWVSFGVFLFTMVLHFLYENKQITSLLFAAAGLTLLFTHNSPLLLSPDMDPIVAVLRSNYWLSTHVLTVTISYAAFTVAMLIGNIAIIRSIFSSATDSKYYKTLAHFAYRMIQLGVFLLSTGIILGGIWADYSWGRFWGWDPKETWALIADLGFLVILHARYAGYVKDFTLLMWTPVAYLLVIMAWYGVNFVLATGLHSYGFSSGGTAFVVSFVSAQLILIALAYLKRAPKLV